MNRLTLTSTTWGSNAQPENRTTVWARAARGAMAVARPSVPAAVTNRRREIMWDIGPLLSDSGSALDCSRDEPLDDEPLEEERQEQRWDDGQDTPGGHERALGRDIGRKAGDNDRHGLRGHAGGENHGEEIVVPGGHERKHR